ncbi:mechanosensitive ion channel protein MscL [Erysipelothrix sp. HDW6B]|nr:MULTISPECIES: mechanosensitive ion channel protein MscL [Erysipelothrix]QIK86469.1 mechanosensitive ion channel protein MscL [Erysipelothrix sp. HDW6B]
MIEDFNGFVSVVLLLVIVVGSITGFVRMNASLDRQEKSDEYYRDLL